MEIEVGEFVRTKSGFIGKIVNENIDAYLLDKRIRPYGDSIKDYCILKMK